MSQKDPNSNSRIYTIMHIEVYNININQSAIERNASIISLIVEKREEKEKNSKFEVAVL